MKILLPCDECYKNNSGAAATHALLTPTDSGYYESVCPYGHVSRALLQQMRFEVLFDIGAYAIHDGYYREAVSSFASALERFLELYIKVSCRRNQIPAATFDAAWKTVSNQSERQLGAYFFLYLQTEGSTAPYLSQDMVALRNSVIHKGRLASRDEAFQFGNAVLAVINPTLQILKERDFDLLQMIVYEHLKDASKNHVGTTRKTVCMSTILSLLNGPGIDDLSKWKPRRFT